MTAVSIPDYRESYKPYFVVTAVAYCSIALLVAGILAYNRIDVFASGAISRMNAMTMITTGGGILIVGLAVLLVKKNCIDEPFDGCYLTRVRIKKARLSHAPIGRKSHDTGPVISHRQSVARYADEPERSSVHDRSSISANPNGAQKQYYLQTPDADNIPILILTSPQAELFKTKLSQPGTEQLAFSFILSDDITGDDNLRSIKKKVQTCKLTDAALANIREHKDSETRNRTFTTIQPESSLMNQTYVDRFKQHSRFTHCNLAKLLRLCTKEELSKVGLKPLAAPKATRTGGASLRAALDLASLQGDQTRNNRGSSAPLSETFPVSQDASTQATQGTGRKSVTFDLPAQAAANASAQSSQAALTPPSHAADNRVPPQTAANAGAPSNPPSNQGTIVTTVSSTIPFLDAVESHRASIAGTAPLVESSELPPVVQSASEEEVSSINWTGFAPSPPPGGEAADQSSEVTNGAVAGVPEAPPL